MNKICAIIPVRGNSKGVPDKGLQQVGGRTLVQRAIDTCRAAGIEQIYVSTDSYRVGTEALQHNAGLIQQPAQISGDDAGAEEALLYALDHLEQEHAQTFDAIVFVQCTSPFIDPKDIQEGIQIVEESLDDMAFAAAPFHHHVWRLDDSTAQYSNYAHAVNHDPSTRLLRQHTPTQWIEAGSFYALPVAGLRATKARFLSGNPKIVSVDPNNRFEIDTPQDLLYAQRLAGEGIPVLQEAGGNTIYVDCDETLCVLPVDRDYERAVPVMANVKWVNRLKDQGHKIVIWTARGQTTGRSWRALTERQLADWGVRYDELSFDKPAFDLLIDDKACPFPTPGMIPVFIKRTEDSDERLHNR